MADQKRRYSYSYAWCVHCREKWGGESAAEQAGRHADDNQHLVHLSEQIEYDVWPAPQPRPAQSRRPTS